MWNGVFGDPNCGTNDDRISNDMRNRDDSHGLNDIKLWSICGIAEMSD